MPINFTRPNTGISYAPPDEAVRDTEKDENWFLQCIRYYSTFYNQSRKSVSGNSPGNDASASNSAPVLAQADEIRANFQYYFGRQENIDYNFITEDSTGKSFQVPWIKGKHAAKLVDFMKGPALQTLQRLQFTATTIDPDSMHDKDILFSQIDIKKDNLAELEFMKSLGIHYNPINDEYELPEEYDDWKEQFQTAGEELAIATANELYELNNAKYKYINAWLHSIVGGVGAIYNYVENGRVKKRFLPSYSVIFDNRVDDDFCEGARFCGFVEQMSIGEIISKWKTKLEGLGENVIDDLKAIAKGDAGANDFINYYNNGCSNFSWWNGTGGDLTVSAVTMFWVAPRDLRYKKSRNRFGDMRLSKLSKEDKNGGDYITNDLHTGVLIGNKYLVDWGLANNVVRDFKNKGNPLLPISLFIPNMTMGETRSTMTMLRQNQDEIDRLDYIIRGLTGKDVGRVLVFRTPLAEGQDHVGIMDDLKNIGATVLAYNADLPDELKMAKFVEVVDLSQVEHVEKYITLRQEQERIMEEILNLSKVALGQMNTYISKGAQQNSVAYSSMGTAYLYEGFMRLVQDDTRYSANQQKMLYSVGKKNEMVRFKTERAGMKFVNVTAEMRYEDVQIYLRVEDVVDQQARERILGLAQAWSQNPEFGVDPIDILMLEKENTLSGMIRKLTYSMKKKKKEAQQQQAYQQMLQQVQSEKALQAQLDQEQMRQQGATQRTQVQEEGKAGKAMLDHHQKMSAQEAPAAQSAPQ